MKAKLWYIRRFLRLLLSTYKNRIIVITGLPRSGSTLVYNICRILLENQRKEHMWAGWINDFKYSFFRRRWDLLLKIHHYDPLIATLPCKFIHTSRNILEIAASLTVKEGQPSLKEIKGYLSDDKKWKKRAHFHIPFQNLNDIPHLIEQIAHCLKIKEFNIVEILRQLEVLKDNSSGNQEYDKENLMHTNHISGAGKKWKTILPQVYIDQIKSLQDV